MATSAPHSAFATPAAGQLGTLGKGAVRGVPITNIDFSMAKNWRFKERYGFQFRAEFFNVLNHANFVGYDLDTRNSTFGTLNSTPPGLPRRRFCWALPPDVGQETPCGCTDCPFATHVANLIFG